MFLYMLLRKKLHLSQLGPPPWILPQRVINLDQDPLTTSEILPNSPVYDFK